MSVYITLAQAKYQCSIDDSLTIHDVALQDMIGAAIDWAENYTNRSLGELLELNSPDDSKAIPVPDPMDGWPDGCPSSSHVWDFQALQWCDTTPWQRGDWTGFWARNPQYAQAPFEISDALPLRRDVKQGILLYIQTLFDRNIADMPRLEERAMNLLWPYRRTLGV